VFGGLPNTNWRGILPANMIVKNKPRRKWLRGARAAPSKLHVSRPRGATVMRGSRFLMPWICFPNPCGPVFAGRQ